MSHGKKIGFNTLSEDPNHPTGSFDFFLQMLGGLAKLDPENSYVVLGSKTNKNFFTAIDPRLAFITAGFSNENRLLRLISEHFILPLRLMRHKVQLLFTTSSGGVAPFWLPRGVALVVAVYATQQFDTPHKVGMLRSVYRKLFTERSLRRASRVVVNSETCRQQLVAQYPWVAEKCRLIHHGVHGNVKWDGDSASARELLRGLSIEKNFVLFVSTIWRYKNVETMITALNVLKKRGVEDLDVVFAGRVETDAYADELRALARKLGVEKNVKFLGRVDASHLKALYKCARVYVQPSLSESFGKTVVEAMTAGCPVVAARAGATPEVLADAGILFEPGNVDDLAKKLFEVLNDEVLRKRLIEKGLLRAKTFDEKNEVLALIDTFNQVSYGQTSVEKGQKIFS